MSDRITAPTVESSRYPTRHFLETNASKLDDFAGGEATYSYDGQSWYVKWDGTVSPLVDDYTEE